MRNSDWSGRLYVVDHCWSRRRKKKRQRRRQRERERERESDTVAEEEKGEERRGSGVGGGWRGRSEEDERGTHLLKHTAHTNSNRGSGVAAAGEGAHSEKQEGGRESSGSLRFPLPLARSNESQRSASISPRARASNSPLQPCYRCRCVVECKHTYVCIHEEGERGCFRLRAN